MTGSMEIPGRFCKSYLETCYIWKENVLHVQVQTLYGLLEITEYLCSMNIYFTQLRFKCWTQHEVDDNRLVNQ